MKNLFFISLFFTSILFNSCSDCPIEVRDPQLLCAPREATITRFEPTLVDRGNTDTDGNIILEPVDEYSIHGFAFPGSSNSGNSSGSLPNDERFENADKYDLATYEFLIGNEKYRAVIQSTIPSNTDMGGIDMLMVSSNIDPINSNNSTVTLRFAGEVERTNIPLFLSENSEDYCSNIISNITVEQLKTFREIPIFNKYNTLNNQPYNLNNFSIVIQDRNLKTVVDPDVINFFNNPNNNILNNAILYFNNVLVNKINVNITLRMGETIYFKTNTLHEYLVTAIDIFRGTNLPQKNRVTIMFTSLN